LQRLGGAGLCHILGFLEESGQHEDEHGPQGQRQSKGVRPLEAQQQPEDQPPDDQVPEVQQDVPEDQAPFGRRELADVQIGHDPLAALLAVANGLALLGEELPIFAGLGHEARFLAVLVLNNNRLNQALRVRTAPGFALRVAILIAALAELVQAVGNLLLVLHRKKLVEALIVARAELENGVEAARVSIIEHGPESQERRHDRCRRRSAPNEVGCRIAVNVSLKNIGAAPQHDRAGKEDHHEHKK
jgi:hypothetical protein